MRLRGPLCSLVLASSLLLGCAGDRLKYPTADSPLKLDRVVLYRNGIGYFERVGEVEGDILTIKVRKDQVNDLLKSLTVVERKSGRAVSVSMPLDPQSWANAALATLQPGRGNLAEVLDALRGTQVTLSTSEGSISGRVVMVEPLEDAPPEPAARMGGPIAPPASTRDHRVTLLDGNEMKVVRLSKVKAVKLADGDLALQFNRTLDASAGEGMFQQVSVSIRLAGASSHDLLVSYVAAAPMWKPTYRVVLPKEGKGKALLQAWAVVDNTSGEDWGDVKLGLTSGAPIAFRYDLHTPRDVPRSDLTESGVRKQAQAMIGEATFDEAPPPPPVAAAPTTPDVAKQDKSGYAYGGDDDGEEDLRDAKVGGKAAPKRPMEAPKKEAKDRRKSAEAENRPRVLAGGTPSPADQPAALEEQRKEIDFESLRRSTQAQARAATVSGQTRFDIDQKVTVPDGTSTMVAIVNADVQGEETFLFRPGGAGFGYEANPYRVVRFKNTTPFVLEPGPISIFAGGSFVGEGLSEAVGANTSATIPFAVETGVMVTSTSKSDREEMRLIKMSRGILEVEQFARRATTYTVKAQTMDSGFDLLVRHPKSGWNYSLAERPEGTEDLPDAYLVKIVVGAGKRDGSLTVVEQTPSKSSISIWDKPALGLLEKLLLFTDLTPDAKKKLQPIVDKRREMAKFEEQIIGLTEKRNKLDQRASELRENIRSIEKNTQANAQRQKWTKQLDEFTSEGNKLGVQLAELEARRLDKRIEMEDLLQDMELTAPPAPATPKKAEPPPAPDPKK
jgi:hypothetical protein